jgi:hypothetical protein
MANQGGDLDGGRELAMVEQKDPLLGKLARTIIKGINTLAKNTATSATGEIAAPKPPDSVSVKVSGEMAHFSISHGGQLQRNVRYFTEISPFGDPSAQPIVVDHGTSRTSHPITLPTMDDDGNITTYAAHSYAQYLSSQPSSPTPARTSTGETTFTMAGTTRMTLLPSTGSGTAANTGQQAGSGLGKVQQRG